MNGWEEYQMHIRKWKTTTSNDTSSFPSSTNMGDTEDWIIQKYIEFPLLF